MGEEEASRQFSHQQPQVRPSLGRGLPSTSSRVAQFTMESTSSDETGFSRFRSIDDQLGWSSGSNYFEDLNDLPSDDGPRPMKTSASMTSMESYASSIMQLSERRPSIMSSVPSIPSPTSDDLYGNGMPHSFSEHGTGRNVSPLEVDGIDYSGGPPVQSSLPETAALARLTCQQVDEMMSLVLAMIRRLDQLDDRVNSLVPAESRPESQPSDRNDAPPSGFSFGSPYTWLKGAVVVAFPVLIAVSVNYFRSGKSRRIGPSTRRS